MNAPDMPTKGRLIRRGSSGWAAPVGALALVIGLTACDGSSTGGLPSQPDAGDPLLHRTGDTEPLYPFQWALDYAGSYFAQEYARGQAIHFHGGLDLNVEPVHRAGYKGQDVRVIVLDTGVDLRHEDLAPNADWGMSWNFGPGYPQDPYPSDPFGEVEAHGTAVAGMIAAAQNGKGVMGIAPRAILGGANYLSTKDTVRATGEAYGGKPWSAQGDVFNASYAQDTALQQYDDADTPQGNDYNTPSLRGLKQLRNGAGAVFIKGAGNSFTQPIIDGKVGRYCGATQIYYPCANPANDRESLEPNAIIVAALNTLGQASSYSSGGSVVWVTGMGGEYGNDGIYGEGRGLDGTDGPTIFSTDLRGCDRGFSRGTASTDFRRGTSARNGVPDNPGCEYTDMNGTSSATPTIAGVAALVLGANPGLSWRDVRDILRQSARPVDPGYASRIPMLGDKPHGARMNLADNTLQASAGVPGDIYDGAVVVPMDLGWQRNAAGLLYSNRYGFGVPDAAQAVALALEYARDPGLGRPDDVIIPAFAPAAYWYRGAREIDDTHLGGIPQNNETFPYGVVRRVGEFVPGAGVVDQFQVRLSSRNVCLGSVGIAVKSPRGTVSLLKLPNDHFQALPSTDFDEVLYYGLGSYAFYGEPAQGTWELYTVSGDPDVASETQAAANCSAEDGLGSPRDYEFFMQARVISQ